LTGKLLAAVESPARAVGLRHTARLTVTPLPVPEKTKEITAIPDPLDQLAEAR
jgi:hypothetical protein